MFKKKSITMLVSLILLLCVTVGGTLAYLIDTAGPVVNTFTPAEVTTTVEEDLSGNVKSNVKIKNTGSAEAYIRAAVVITWQDKDGNVYGTAPVEGTDYVIDWGHENWDTETSDGFYYYKLPVAAGASTENLYDSIEVGQGTAPEGYALTVEIIGSGIQSIPVSVVQTEWGVTVNGTTISK